MKAGIMIDKWKLDILTKYFDEKGIEFTEDGVLCGSLLITVITDDLEKLADHLVLIEQACTRSRMH